MNPASDAPTTHAFASPHPGSPDATPLPETIGPFRILGLLGEGGMGRVFHALQAEPEREVALKVAGLQTRAVIERFQREVDLLARLEHPGIARLYASGVDAASGQPWLAMELVKGEELGTWARRVSPDRQTCIEVLQSLCAAVAYAHDRGILHRDLKPSNLFIDHQQQIRVLDFGIARLLDTARGVDSTLTVAGQVLGTLPYMAPEQLRGEAVDARADVYALGVIAYELIGRQLPYPRLRTASAFEALDILRAGDPPQLEQLTRSAHGDLGRIVMKAIESEPSRRYPSVDALAADLAAVLEHRPVSARAPTRAYLAGRFVRRHRALTTAVVSTMLILLTSTAVSLRFAWSEAQARAQTELRAAEARAISGFLEETLLSADPERSLGQSIRVIELIEPAAQGLLDDTGLAPEARVRLLSVLAGVYTNLGDGARALELIAPAQRTLAETGIDSPELRDELLNRQVEGLLGDAKYAEAEALIESELAAPKLDRAPAYQIALQGSRIRAAIEQGRHADSEIALRELIPIAERELGRDDAGVLTLIHNLGTLMEYQGKWQEAVEINRDVTARRIAKFGPEHPQTLYSRNLGAVLGFRVGNEAAALAEMESLLAARRKRQGPEHPSTWISSLSLASALLNAGERDRAEALLREVQPKISERFGASSGYSLTALSSLALALEQKGELDRAAALYREGMRSTALPDGSLPAQALQLQNNLGMLLLDSGKAAEALAEFESLVPRAETALGTQHPFVGMFTGNLAQALADSGRAGEARVQFERSLELLDASLGKEHPRTQKVRGQLDALRAGSGK